MRGSGLLPWLFFGPLFTAVTAGAVHAVCGGPVWARIAQAAAAITMGIALAAFLAARRRRS